MRSPMHGRAGEPPDPMSQGRAWKTIDARLARDGVRNDRTHCAPQAPACPQSTWASWERWQQNRGLDLSHTLRHTMALLKFNHGYIQCQATACC